MDNTLPFDMPAENLPAEKKQTPGERAAVALLYNETEKHLTELNTKSKALLKINDKAGYDDVDSMRKTLVKARTSVTKHGKSARDDSNAFSKAVIDLEKKLLAINANEEARLVKMLEDFNNAEKLAEQKRIAEIQNRIAWIKQEPPRNATASDIKLWLDERRAANVDATYQEFQKEAAAAKEASVGALLLMHNTALKAERVAEEQKAEAERLAKQQAELKQQQEEMERQKKELADMQAKIAADAKALEDAKKAAEVESSKPALEAGETLEAPEFEEIPIDNIVSHQAFELTPVDAVYEEVSAGEVIEIVLPDEAKKISDSIMADMVSAVESGAASVGIPARMVWGRTIEDEQEEFGPLEAVDDEHQGACPTPEQEQEDRDKLRRGIIGAIGHIPAVGVLHSMTAKEIAEEILEILTDALDTIRIADENAERFNDREEA
jgi:hypothetical protein